MKKVFYIAFISLVSMPFLAPANDSSALSCARRDLNKDFANFDTVVEGKVMLNKGDMGGGDLSLRLNHVYKGELKKDGVVEVSYEADFGGTMSLAKKNDELLIFANASNGNLRTPVCPGVINLENKDSDVWLYGFESRKIFTVEFNKIASQYGVQKPTIGNSTARSGDSLGPVTVVLAVTSVLALVIHRILKKGRSLRHSD